MEHLSTLRGPAWQVGAPCADKYEVFFPEVDNPSKEDFAAAAKVCRRCPVREACLEYALKVQPEYGMWGGKTPREREALKRKGVAA